MSVQNDTTQERGEEDSLVVFAILQASRRLSSTATSTTLTPAVSSTFMLFIAGTLIATVIHTQELIKDIATRFNVTNAPYVYRSKSFSAI